MAACGEIWGIERKLGDSRGVECDSYGLLRCLYLPFRWAVNAQLRVGQKNESAYTAVQYERGKDRIGTSSAQ